MSNSPPKTAKILTKRLGALRGGPFIGLLTLVMILGGGGLYYGHITERKAFLIERNFRLLATLGSNMEKKLQSYSASFRFTEDEFKQQSKDGSEDQSGGGWLNFYLKLAKETQKIKHGLYDEAKKEKKGNKKKPDKANDPEKLLEEKPYISDCSFDGNDTPAYRSGSHELIYSSQLGGKHYFCRIKLSSIMEGLQFKQAFQDLILVDYSRKVVYQKDSSQYRFFSLDNLLNQEKNDTFLDQVFGKSSNTSSDGQNEKKTADSFSAPFHQSFFLGGTKFEVFAQPVFVPEEFLGNPKGDGDTAKEGLGNAWSLVGIVQSSHFQDQYLALPFTYLLLIIFVLLSLVLTIPLIRLLMMAQSERLSRFNLYAILFATVIGTASLTFFVLDTNMYNKMKWDINKQLKQSALNIHNGFQEELTRILEQLTEFDTSTQALKTDMKYVLEQEIKDTQGQTQETKTWRARDQISCENEPKCLYPNFRIAFWVDQEEVLRINWTQEDNPSVRGAPSIPDRLYVKHVLDPQKPLYRKRNDGKDWKFFIEPIVAYDSGEKSVVVSMRHGDPKSAQANWVAAIEMELASLMKSPVLPSGNGFAVVDDQSGDVWFHSIHERSVKAENLFKETDRNPELEALIYARMAGFVEGDYWGRAHQFFVMPITDLPWSLVVFQEKITLRGINFEILWYSGTLFSSYLIIVSILVLSVLVIVRLCSSVLSAPSFVWLWPNSLSQKRYQIVLLINLLVTGGLCWYWMSHTTQSAEETYALAFCAPILNLAFFLVMSWVKDGNGIGSFTKTSATLRTGSIPYGWYTTMIMSTLVVFAAFPAFLFFNIAQDQEVKVWKKYHLYSLSHALRQRTGSLQLVQASNEDKPIQRKVPQTIDPLLWKDLRKSIIPLPSCPKPPEFSSIQEPPQNQIRFVLNGIYKNFSFPIQMCLFKNNGASSSDDTPLNKSVIGEEHSILDRWYRAIRAQTLEQGPLYERGPLIETWAMSDEIWDTSLKWKFGAEKSYKFIGLTLQNYPTNESTEPSTWLQLQTLVPLQSHTLFSNREGKEPLNLNWFLLVGLYGIILGSFPYMVIRRIFASPFSGSSLDSLEIAPNEFSKETEQNFLILGPPGSGKTQLAREFNKEKWEVIDLRGTSNIPGWAALTLDSLKNSSKPIAIDHFEYHFGFRIHDQEKQQLLEGLLMERKQIIILSARNPLQGLAQQEELTPNQVSRQAEDYCSSLQDWSALLRSFALMYYQEPTDPERLKTLQMAGPGPRGWVCRLRHQKMHHTFFEEASGNRFLQALGQWVQKKNGWEDWTSDQVINQFLGLAKPHYHTIWQSCSMEERLALYHVAIDGFLRAEHPELPRLNLKGLVRFAPNLRLMNESFRRFVLIEGARDQLDSWKAKEGKSLWATLRLPLFILVGGGVVFLFTTQQNFQSSVAALVSIFPFLLPAIPDLSNLIPRSRQAEQ